MSGEEEEEGRKEGGIMTSKNLTTLTWQVGKNTSKRPQTVGEGEGKGRGHMDTKETAGDTLGRTL